jgi:sugar/nucleoside kinase (ribokinase family)
MRESLVERGVDISQVGVDPELATGISIMLGRGDDRSILTALGTISCVTAEIDHNALGGARHVHVTPVFLLQGLLPDLRALLTQARAAGATTSFDPNWDPKERWDGGILDAVAEADVFFANAEEAKRLARTDSVQNAARILAARGPLVVVKLGAEGALAVHRGDVFRAPALRVEVADTVGAGDSFNAGFLSGFLGGRSVQESLTLAVTCGSLSARAPGGTAAQATLAEATAH